MTDSTYEGQDPRPSRGIFAGFIVVCIASILLVVVGVGFFYQRCTADFWRTDWLYPGAEVVAETSQFFSTQQRILLTADSAAAVDQWVSTRAAQITREAVTSGDFSAMDTAPAYVLEPDASGGTRIVFTQSCP